MKKQVLRKKAKRPISSFVTISSEEDDIKEEVLAGKYGMDDIDDCVSSDKAKLEGVVEGSMMHVGPMPSTSLKYADGQEYLWHSQVRPYYCYEGKIILAQYLLEFVIIETKSRDFLINVSTPMQIIGQNHMCFIKKEDSRGVELFIDRLNVYKNSKFEIGIECPYGDMDFGSSCVYNINTKDNNPPLKSINVVFFEADLSKNRCDADIYCKDNRAWRNFVFINEVYVYKLNIETGYFITDIDPVNINSIDKLYSSPCEGCKIDETLEEISEVLAKLEARDKFERDFDALQEQLATKPSSNNILVASEITLSSYQESLKSAVSICEGKSA